MVFNVKNFEHAKRNETKMKCFFCQPVCTHLQTCMYIVHNSDYLSLPSWLKPGDSNGKHFRPQTAAENSKKKKNKTSKSKWP